jgi:hypothetical protein
VPETTAEQDEAIRALAESELADLETQPNDVVKVQMRTTSLFHGCPHGLMTERLVALAQLHHSRRRQTSLC